FPLPSASSGGCRRCRVLKLPREGCAMGWIQRLEKVAEGHYVLPKTKTMRVDADLFLSDNLLYGDGGELAGLEEGVFDQVVNAASFPGVTRVAVTPDCHVGYGVPIGTVVETDGILLPT